MTENTIKFNNAELAETLVEYLKGVEYVVGCDVIDEVYNSDYEFIYTSEARKAIDGYGVFNAIDEIQEWFENQGLTLEGQELGDPVAMANLLWYIKGYQFINEELEKMGSYGKYVHNMIHKYGGEYTIEGEELADLIENAEELY